MVQFTQEELNKKLGLDSVGNDATKLIGPEENNTTSTIVSALAGIGSGLIKIPEGIVSLGATLLDLGADSDKAAQVEKWFADINPFDELAEKTTAGKLTEVITNLAVPGGFAFKAGSNLAKNALIAKKSGKYLDLGGDTSKAITKKLKGIEKLNKIETGLVDDAFSKTATTGEKVLSFASGAGLGGIAEGLFVDDVQEVGSFGDLIGGPSALERESDTPEDELLNRLKFGLEGAAFTGILGGLGTTVKKLKNQKDKGRVVDGKFNKFVDEFVSASLRSRGKKTTPVFEGLNKERGARAADVNFGENIAFDLDKKVNKLFPFYKRLTNNAETVSEIKNIKKEMNQTLLSGIKKGELKPNYYDFQLNEVGRESGKTLDEIVKNSTLKKKLTEPGFTVEFGKISNKIENDFKKTLKKYGASSEMQDDILLNLNGVRSYLGNMFSSIGRRLDDKSLKTFKETFGNKVTTWLDSGYEVFKNDPIEALKLYKPSNQIIKETAKQFQAIAKKSGINLNEETADNLVNEVWKTAKIEKGFKLKSPSDAYFKIPDFFVEKSFAKRAVDLTPKKYQLSDIPDNIVKVDGLEINRRDAIKKLLGKTDDAMSTILIGTNKLSAIVRRNEFYDSLLIQSNKAKAVYDEWLKNGKVGPRPAAPIFVDSQADAYRYFGGSAEDVGEQLRFDSGIDRAQKLKPLDAKEALLQKRVDEQILNPLQNKFALKGNTEAIQGVEKSLMGEGFGAQLYQNLVLYPKATSQMAKTVLAPFTHARNFLSAGAFAAANGIIPFGDMQAVRQSFEALQIGTRTKAGNELYQKLLKLGVVNSQVQLGDLQRLLKDVDFGSTLGSINSINGLFKRLSQVKKFAQDAYTAEDDFWKIFSWFGESKRLEKAYKNSGLRLGQKFTDASGVERTFNQEFLEQEAANLVKNQIPNYSFVSEFVKGLRKFPLGNFVSFPAEIMRTSTNIVQRALDEIYYTTTINGKQVNPLRSIGMQRLIGMGITSAAVPYAAVSAGQMLYDVSQEELEAIRRFVPKWSKNSTLIPLRDEKGNLEYIDFSHMNAYDTITRPIQTVLNAVQEGRTDKNGIMGDFLLGLIESTKELGAPFITESIWTKALQDVSPILGRGGIDAEGRRIWNRVDSTGDKIYKGMAHLIESQAPLNWKQLERIGLAMKPIDSKGKFDIRGNEYELGNELRGIAGMRTVKVNPDKSLGYKIKDYKDGVRNSRNIFTAGTTKGGAITPVEIVDYYIKANEALFKVNREMYKDLKAAKTIGMKEDAIEEQMNNRGESRAYNYLTEGEFRPLTISQPVQELFDINASALGLRNPFDIASDIIDSIQDLLESVPVSTDYFPSIINPLENLPEPTLGPAANLGTLPPMITGANPIVMNANQQIVSGVGPNKLNQQIEKSNAIDSFIGK